MSGNYQLGKDMASMMESLTRLESRMTSLEQNGLCRCRESKANAALTQQGAPAPMHLTAGKALSRVAPTKEVSATPIAPFTCGQRLSPDFLHKYVCFAEAFDTSAGYADADIDAYVYSVGTDRTAADLSVSTTGYRPTGLHGKTALLAIYSSTLGQGWITVRFDVEYLVQGRFPRWVCCESITHGYGQTDVTHTGWATAIMNFPGGYKLPMNYADCDSEIGLSFAFAEMTKS